MAENVQIDDFGEKIGGARKDIWHKRGLFSIDIDEMNSREADKYVVKDNIWKKPDYEALIESGVPFDVVYYIKKVRDSLPASPVYLRNDDTPEKRTARQKEYVDTVREIQGIIDSIQTKDGVLAAFSRCMVDNGYFERPDGSIGGVQYKQTLKYRQNPTLSSKLINALYITSERAFEQEITRIAIKEQFGVPKDQKVPKGYEVLFHDGKNSFSQHDDWIAGTFFVARGHQILKANFESREAALKWAQDIAAKRSGGKKRLVPPQLERIVRNGPDYRRDRNVEGQDYLDTFGFRGGEFGNWMSQIDRQASLNYGYDALKDLADALKISDMDISFQGELAIAFGARGIGRFAAHYESSLRVINLTKMKGAGFLAHEWWHGLDDYLGTKLGVEGLLSEKPRVYPQFAKLIDTIKYKPETIEQATARSETQGAQLMRNAESWLKSSVLPYITRAGDEKTTAAYETIKDAFLRGEAGSVSKLSELKKSVSGRIIPKDERTQMQSYERIFHSLAEQSEPAIRKVHTDYYKNSIRMGHEVDRDGGYWESNTELTARAFATYIMDRLPSRSDYLAGHAESAVTLISDKSGNPAILRAYPEGDERKAINAVFDEIIADLKLQHHLTHDNRVMPERRVTLPDVSHVKAETYTSTTDGQLSLFHQDMDINVATPSTRRSKRGIAR